MVDHLQDPHSPFKGYIGDIVLPDLPPSAEAFATRVAQRLYVRRWLLLLSASVIVVFVLAYGLPIVAATLGLGSIAAGAAFLPREGVFRQASLNLRLNERHGGDQAAGRLLEGIPAPAILLDTAGQVLGFNSLAGDFLPSLRKYQHLSSFIRDPGVLEAVASADAELHPQQIVGYEQRVPIERHMEATVSWIGTAASRRPERAPAILIYLRDLTEPERLDRLRTDFIANASHELRTPLASLLGFIETLQGAARNDPAAREHFLQIMARQAHRMTRLIDDLLSLSRIEMRVHLKPQDVVDLNDVADNVLASMEPLAAKAGTEVHLTELGEPAWVLGERDELIQLVSNLVENAIKYGRGGGNVWVSIAAQVNGSGRKFVLTVRDDGHGIADMHLPRLTERFYRANDAGGEKSGTGLGLAIVKHVVTRHRGELKIASRIGEGSTFTVTLSEAPAGA
jgi:two-component system, OmpR family, phosphate regulon sensor histidine kinase PhoR